MCDYCGCREQAAIEELREEQWAAVEEVHDRAARSELVIAGGGA